jgi:hypothetical protein
MDPTVIGVVVGVGGTVVAGIAGYDRESKVWDQRAAVYVETLATVHYRQVARKRHDQPRQ